MKSVEEMRAEIGVKPWNCWITYGHDHGAYVDGIYPTEIEALRRVNEAGGLIRAKQVFAGEVDEQLQ